MSGPVEEAEGGAGDTASAGVEVSASRETRVGGHRVRRALPQRGRRTVGPWCFADHLGPVDVAAEGDLRVGPHPHIGLQTATWLLGGEVLHRDSLGTEQPIRPGQLNLMTAGNGVSHAEEGTGRSSEAHGIQLWIAQPEATRHGDPDFEHQADLPILELGQGGGQATVLVGSLGDVAAPTRRDTDHVGAELVVRSECEAPLDEAHEHAVVVLEGMAFVDGTPVVPGQLGYVSPGRASLAFEGDARLLLLGGVPFESPIVMWWNFVARSRDEIDAAARDWEADADHRFGDPASSLDRIPVPRRPWTSGGLSAGRSGPGS
jgi:quercetin 2,3-dioxygenase